jgi:hypothetical protein
MKEKAYNFFPHILGKHNWQLGVKFADLVQIEPATKIGKNFNQLCFTQIDRCTHQAAKESFTPAVRVNSKAVQKMIELTLKPAFADDMARLKPESATSSIESAHSVYIAYCPKRKYYTKRKFMLKTMLGIMHWNAVQDAELSGERQIEQWYSYFSKARGAERQKVKKSAGSDYWKRELVERSVDRKRQLGPGLP